MPLSLLRVMEGLLALVYVAGVLASIFFWTIVMRTGPNEIFGIWVTPINGFVAIVVCMLGAIWFGSNAIRGESTPTEGSERDSARKG